MTADRYEPTELLLSPSSKEPIEQSPITFTGSNGETTSTKQCASDTLTSIYIKNNDVPCINTGMETNSIINIEQGENVSVVSPSKNVTPG